MNNSSNSSTLISGKGNTNLSPPKQISPSKRWCFTLNNYTNEELLYISSIVPEYCEVYIIGKEVGENGTPHLQGYIEFITKKRPLSVFNKIARIHWEKARASKHDNFIYCSKDAKIFMQNGYKLPKKVKVLDESQLYDWQKELIDIITEEPDDRTIYWYWSEEGCVGKTTFCKYLTVKYGAICLHGKGADVRNGIVDYKSTNGDTPDIILFPIPRSYNSEYLSYEALENIKDMYFYSGKYEGGMICGNCPHLVVFSNEEPDYERCSKDRWIVKNIDKKNKNIKDYFD